jgi:hypothetical protein
MDGKEATHRHSGHSPYSDLNMGPDLLLAISTTSDKVSTEFSGSHVFRTVHMVVERVRVHRPEVEGSIGDVRARVLRQEILQWQSK